MNALFTIDITITLYTGKFHVREDLSATYSSYKVHWQFCTQSMLHYLKSFAHATKVPKTCLGESLV